MGFKDNATEYGFGQLGSIFTDSTTTNIKPPVGKVFVAITMVEDTNFDTSLGLVHDSTD